MIVERDEVIRMVDEMSFFATRLFKEQDISDMVTYFTISGAIDSAIGVLWEPNNYSSVPASSKEFISRIVNLRLKHSREMAEIIKERIENKSQTQK